MPARVDHPITLLRREHDEALAVLYQLEAAVRALTMPGVSGRSHLDLGAIEKPIAFLDEEVRAHNEREEESLFPVLERYLPPSGPTAVMRFEHREFWNLLSALQAAVRESPPSPSTICERGLAVVDLLRRHIEKENGILFPIAEQLLSSEDMSGVARKMEKLIDARTGARAGAVPGVL
jgi:hemerythrin-like domain-containing protein